MQQSYRYEGFLKSKMLWQDQDFQDLSPFEFSTSEQPNNSIYIEIPENEVLGKRVEYYFEYYLQNSIRYKLIAKNIQVFKDKITIGELDFLIWDKKYKQTLHLELIYKFYLYQPEIGTAELNKWIGPNRKDSLIEKINKLKEKQLPLLYKKEALQLLDKIDVDPKNIQQKVAYFGHLFIPGALQNKTFSYINPECIVGRWIQQQDFSESTFGTYLFHIPDKKNWMVDPKVNECWDKFIIIEKQVTSHLKQKKSPLLWIKNNEDSFERLFIVWW